MSAGNLIGSVLLTIFFAAFWTVLGKVVDTFARVANLTFATMPVYQSGINGFNMQAGIFGILGVIVIAGIWGNYLMNAMSERSQEV
jgi:hypothetical protein